MNQNEIAFSDRKDPDERIAEYEKFKETVGAELLQKLIDIAENARVAMRLLKGHKNPSHDAIVIIINRNYMEEFRLELPHMSNFEILRHTSEAAHVVFEHLEFLRSINPSYQSGMLRRKERQVAIKGKEMSSKFPTNFVPPPNRKRIKVDSLPDEEWLKAVIKDPSRLTALRKKNDEAWESARRKGKAPKLGNPQLKLF